MTSRFSSRAAGALAVCLVIGASARPAAAQNAAAFVTHAGAQAAPAPAGDAERRVLKDILEDQRDIWTSPLRVSASDAKWLLPSLLAAAALVASDKEINSNLSRSDGAVRASDRVSHVGSGYTLLGASGAFYLAGRLGHDDRAKKTGLLAFEAIVDETIVVTALKAATNRERPDKANGRQDFFDGGKAFPSGHAAASWAFAEVVAEQYRDEPLVRWGAYGVATAVSVARVTALKHSPSDVFLGAFVGYLIGRRVARRGASGGGTFFTLAPVIDPSTRTRGVAGTLRF